MTKPTEAEFQEIISYLNRKAQKNFIVTEAHRRLMRARFRERINDEVTIEDVVEDFKLAIDNQVRSWFNDPKMRIYLRPQTIFNGKFDSYVNNTEAAVPGMTKDKPVERKPDPLEDNEEYNAAIKVTLKCFGRSDSESRKRYEEAMETMKRLKKEEGE